MEISQDKAPQNISANNKRIAKNTMYLYFRMLINIFVGIFTSRVIFQTLGQVDYGLYNVVAGVIVFLSYISGTLATSTTRYVTVELGKKDLVKLKEIFRTAQQIHLLLSFFVLILGETVGVLIINYILNIPDDRMLACNIVFQVVILTSIISINQSPLMSLIISHEHMNAYAYLGVFDVVLKLLVAFLLYFSFYDKLITYGILLLIVSLVVFQLYFFYCLKHFREIFSFSILFKQLNKSLANQFLKFTMWNLLGSTSIVFRNQGVNLLINVFFGSIVNAANAIAYQVNSVITQFSSNFTMAVNPQITKSYASGEYDQMKKLIVRGCKFSFFLLLYLCIPIIFETNFLLTLWLGEIPEYTVILTRLVLLLSLVECFIYPIGCAIQANGNIRNYQIIISITLLLNFPISLLLFYLHAQPYAALTISLIISIFTIIERLYFMKSLLRIEPVYMIKKIFLRCMIVFLICLILPYFISRIMDDSFIRLFSILFCVILFNSVFIYIFGLEKNERNFVHKTIKNFILK